MISSISNAVEPEVSEILGRKMQSRARQVFVFCDKDHDCVLSVAEQSDADAKLTKILDGMSKDREIGRNRIPPAVDEPLYADSDQVTVDEFVQHFQAMASIADARTRAIHNSKSKMVTFQAPILVPVVTSVPMRAPTVVMAPYPVFIEEPHHHHHQDLENRGMSPQQSASAPSQVAIPEHHHVEQRPQHEQHQGQVRSLHSK
jgi:hypothetical protein